MAIESSNLSFTAGANGYMLLYKGKPIGGSGVVRREKPLHWRHARGNVILFSDSAKREIASIIEGNGSKRYLDAIAEIDKN